MTEQPANRDFESFILTAFEQNYQELRIDSGHAIAPDVKETALQQVLLYWRMLHEIAENVTDTEVRLSLPGLETPHERSFTIEGVVDILRDNERVIMYDIKTHNADYVRANTEQYEQQLNIYAFIWKNLRQQSLDEMAIIATDFPETVKEALSPGNEKQLDYALKHWEPVVQIPFNLARVDQTIIEFGKVVDCIEEGCFTPPSLERLNETMPGTRAVRFGTHVCRNCDARFSCSSYRKYAWQGRPAIRDRSTMEYFREANNDIDQETWRSANLEALESAADLRADFSSRG